MLDFLSRAKKIYSLLRSIDVKQLDAISKKVDLLEVIHQFGKLDENQIAALMKLMKGSKSKSKRELPPINADFYDLSASLSFEDRELQLRVRLFMENEIKPIVNKYWNRAEFPFEIIPKFAELDICGITYQGYGCPNRSFLMEGILASEMGRVDASIATFFGVQSGLAMGSIYVCGSEEQKQ
ncbi:acyl-CoA dehydrogenase, partial [Pseudoxanthomonas sp. SGD-10]